MSFVYGRNIHNRLRHRAPNKKIGSNYTRGWVQALPAGRDDKIRTCDFYVPNVALYQTEPHLDYSIFSALRALPVVTKSLSSFAALSRQSTSHCHSFLLPSSATGGGRKRPQTEPHLDYLIFLHYALCSVVPKNSHPRTEILYHAIKKMSRFFC